MNYYKFLSKLEQLEIESQWVSCPSKAEIHLREEPFTNIDVLTRQHCTHECNQEQSSLPMNIQARKIISFHLEEWVFDHAVDAYH